MSEELIKSLNQRIAELERSKANLEVALRGERKDLKAVKEELTTLRGETGTAAQKLQAERDALMKERDELKTRADAAPGEKDTRIKELETTLRTRDLRDQFAAAIGKDLAEGVSVEDLWHFGKFDPSAVESLDDKQITDLAARVKETTPILFGKPVAAGNAAGSSTGTNGVGTGGGASQGTHRQPLKVGDSASRGARDTASGTVRYTRSEVQQPGWSTTPRGKEITAARLAGTAELVDATT